jgi:hypothetical protein
MEEKTDKKSQEYTRETILAIAKGMFETAKKIREESTEEAVTPTAFIVSPEKGISVLGLSFSNQEEKKLMYTAVTLTAVQDGSIAVILINDARVMKIPRKQAKTAAGAIEKMREAYPEAGMLADDPIAQEILTLFIRSPLFSIAGYFITAEYKRDAGKIIWGEENEGEPEQLQNNLVPPWWLMPELKKIAEVANLNLLVQQVPLDGGE